MSTVATGRSFLSVLIRRPSIWFGLIGTALVLAVVVALSPSSLSRRRAEKLPVISSVPAFEFTNQHGQPFGTQALKGQVWVANFIFTRCPTICPTFTAKMASIQKQKPESLQLVSFTVDPEYDTPPVLDAYARKYEAGSSWSFLSGSREALTSVVENGMLQPMEEPIDPANLSTLVHGSYFVLVDKQLKVRGLYLFSEPRAVEQVLLDAKALLAE